MANIRKMGNTWHVQYRVNGRQRSKSGGRLTKDALRLKAQIERDLLLEEYKELPNITFADFAQKWIDDYAKPSVKDSTFISYELIVRVPLLPSFRHFQFSAITPSDIQRLVATKTADGLAAKTVGNILVVLKKMFRCAVDWGYLMSDPSAYIRRPRGERTGKSLRPAWGYL